jgi:hypothetical protein
MDKKNIYIGKIIKQDKKGIKKMTDNIKIITIRKFNIKKAFFGFLFITLKITTFSFIEKSNLSIFIFFK